MYIERLLAHGRLEIDYEEKLSRDLVKNESVDINHGVFCVEQAWELTA